MRTTVNIEDDVLIAVRERARRQKRTIGGVLSELARQALRSSSGPEGEVRARETFYGFEPLPRRGMTVSNDLVERLREEEDV